MVPSLDRKRSIRIIALSVVLTLMAPELSGISLGGQAADTSSATPTSSPPTPPNPGTPLPPGTVNSTIAPLVSTIADWAFEPRLLRTNTSYIYQTPSGNYTFPKDAPYIMAYATRDGVPLVTASTFFVTPTASSIIYNPRVVAATNHTFTVDYNVTVDALTLAQATVKISTAFSAYRAPKISAKFIPSSLAPLPSFNFQWGVQPSVYYLELNQSRTLDIRSLLPLLSITASYFTAKIGDSSSPGAWKSYLMMDWSDAASGNLSVGPLNMPGLGGAYGLLVTFPSNRASIDPSLVGTTGAFGSPTAFSHQRKVFFYGGYYWAFYSDGNGVRVKTSLNGRDWSPATDPATGATDVSFDVAQRGGVVALAWVDSTQTKVYVKLGALSMGSISWGGSYAFILATPGAGPAAVAIASDGYIWLAWTSQANECSPSSPCWVYHRWVYRSKDTFGSDYVQVLNEKAVQNDPKEMLRPVALSKGKMVLLITHGSTTGLWWKFWDAGWLTSSYYNTNSVSIGVGFTYSWTAISAVATSDDTVHVAYNDIGGALDYIYITGGTAAAPVSLDPGANLDLIYPSLGIDGNANVYLFYSFYQNLPPAYTLKYRVKTGRGWTDPLVLLSSVPPYLLDYVSASAVVSDQAFMLYTAGYSGSPEVRFLSLPLPSGLGGAASQPWTRDGVSPYGEYFKQLSDYVAPGTGLLTVIQTDINLPGRGLDLTVSRVFTTPRTFLTDASGAPYPYAYDSYNGANLGLGWQLNFPWIGQNNLHLWNGQTYIIRWDANNVFEVHAGEHFRLAKLACGTVCYRLTTKSGGGYDFDTTGRLLKATDGTGKNYVAFTYGSNGITSITDTAGRAVTFTYDTNNRLWKLTWGSGSGSRTVEYRYTNGGQLYKVIDPLLRTSSFYYSPTNPYLLSEIVYPTGGKTAYTYSGGQLGSEASTFQVTLQNVYNGSALVKSTSFSYSIVNGRVLYSKVTISDGKTVQGSTAYNFNGPGGSSSVSQYFIQANGPMNEDFEDNAAQGFQVNGGTWSILSVGPPRGKVYLGQAAGGSTAYVTALNSGLKDYRVQARVSLVSGSEIWLGGRAQDTNPLGNLYRIGLSGSTLYFQKWVAGAGTTFASENVNAGSEWHILALEFRGTNIRAYYDDAFKWEVFDGQFSSGKIALQGYSSGATSNLFTYDFDDVVVSSPEQKRRTVNWFDGGGQNSQQDVYSGSVDTKTYSTMQSYDNWGNLVYSRDAQGHEKFASYANTSTSNVFYAPGRLAPTYSGKILQASFDDWGLGGWILDAAGGSIALDSQMDPTLAPSVKITPSTAAASARRYFPSQGVSVVVEGKVMPAQTNKDVYFYVNSGTTVRAFFRFRYDGVISYSVGTSEIVTTRSYGANVWHKVAFVVYLSGFGGNQYDMCYDGCGFADGAPLMGSGNVDNLQIQASGTVYLDDFKVYASGKDRLTQYSSDLVINGLAPGMKVEALDDSGGVLQTQLLTSTSTSFRYSDKSFNFGDTTLKVYNNTQPTRNGNMEAANVAWTYVEGHGATSGPTYNNNFDPGVYITSSAPPTTHSGSGTYKLTMSIAYTFSAGDWASLYQDVTGLRPFDPMRVWFKLVPDTSVGGCNAASSANVVSVRLSISDYGDNTNPNMRDLATLTDGGKGFDWTQLVGTVDRSSFRLHLRVFVNADTNDCTRYFYVDDADGPAEYTSPSRDLWGGDVYSYIRPVWRGGDFYNASSPILYYDMQSTTSLGSKLQMQDLSGNNNQGTVTGTTSADGYLGLARHFNGGTSGDVINSAPSASLDIRSEITLAAWFKADDVTSNQKLVMLSGDKLSGTFTHKAILGISNGSLYPEIQTQSGNDYATGAGGAICVGVGCGQGGWYHYAMTYRPSEGLFRVYLNGNPTVTVPTDGQPIWSTTGVIASVGAWPNTAFDFKGVIDEVYIFDRALSAAEVGTLYAKRGPVLNYDMETLNPSNQMQDLSGRDNNGQIAGTTSVNGFLGAARNFTSSTDQIAAPTTFILSTSAFTATFWMKPTAYPTSGNLFMGGQWNSGDIVYFGIGSDGKVFGTLVNTIGAYYSVFSDVAVPRGVYTHYAFSFDGSTLRLYINRVAQALPTTFSGTPRTPNGLSPFVYGNYAGLGSFRGVLDEAYVFDRALPPSEVQDNYLRKLPIDAHDRLLGRLEWQNGSLDPVAYYDMQTLARSDLVKDVSGHGNEGMLIGTGDSAGYAGRSRSFNGNGDWIKVSEASTLDITGDITMALWMYLSADPNCDVNNNWRVLMSKYSSSGSSFGPYFVILEENRIPSWSVTVNGAPQRFFPTSGAVPVGIWTHVAFTRVASTGVMSYYVNGALVQPSTGLASGSMDTSTGELRMGGGYVTGCPSHDGFFQGNLDEVRVYDRALSASEIQEMASRILWLDMETFTSGNILREMSGYQNTGTLSGTTPIQGKVGKALKFNGISDYVSVSDSSSLEISNAITLTAWVRMDGLPGGGYGGIWFDQATTYRSRVLIPSDGSVLAQFNIGGVDQSFGTATGLVPTGTFTHIAYTYDGTTERIYVNGVPRANHTISGGLAIGTSARFIGKGFSNTYYFNGVIDEVTVYNRALSAPDVSALFQPRTTLPMRFFYRYDPQGQLLETRAYHNASWIYTQADYGPFGNVIWRSDADYKVAQYAYSSQYGYAYLTQVTRPDSTTEGYTYDFNTGAQLSATDANGHTTRYTYDLLGRPLNGSFPAVGGAYSSTANRYDDLSNSVTIYDENSKNRTLHLDMETTLGINGRTRPLYYDMERIFDGKVEDLSGTGNHGTLTGTASTNGMWGLGRTFNGATDYVEAPSTASLQLGNKFTLATWVKWDGVRYTAASAKDFAAIFAKGGYTTGEYTLLMHRVSGATDTDIKLYSNGVLRATWSNSLIDVNWHHLAVTYDGATVTFYLDGVSKSPTTVTFTPTAATNALRVGAESSGNLYPWGGALDEAYIFDRALPATDVSRLYGQNAVTMLEDLSGNGNHATIYGTTLVAGKVGNGRNFNGNGDYATMGKPVMAARDNWAMVAWVKPSVLKTLSLAVYNGNDAGGYGFGIGNGVGGSGSKLVGLLGSVAWLDSGYTFPSTGTWYHVAMVRQAGITKFYVNGAQTANTFSQTPNAPTFGASIGTEYSTANVPTRFFNGAIDEVHAFDHAISASEVQDIYNSVEGGHYEKRYLDGIGRIIKSSRRDFFGSLLSSKTTTYTWLDEVASSTDALGNVYTVTYDFLGRGINSTNPDGSYRKSVYDDVNNIRYVYDEVGRLTSYQSNWVGQLVRVGEWNPVASTYNYTSHTYLEDGQLSSVADASSPSKITRHTYDDLGRLVRTAFPDGNKTFEAYVYDNRGNLIQKTLRNGTTINYAYDSMNRLINTTYPGGGWISRLYDKEGNLKKVRGPVQGANPWVLWFQYDERDRLTLEAQNITGTNRTVQYWYDGASNLITMTYGGTAFTYTYDNFNRNAKVTSGSITYATFTFRQDDQITSILYGNNVRTTYTFDAKRAWPLHMWVNASGGTGTNLLNMAYTNSVAGEVTKIQLDRSGIHSNETYTYDGQDRLLKYTYTPAGGSTYSQTYTYDSVGNRATLNDNGANVTNTYREDNRLVQSVNGTITDYFYDRNGNQFERKQGTTYRTFVFDYDNQLRKVNESSVLATSDYDGMGRRVKGAEKGSTAYYLFAGQRMVFIQVGITPGIFLYANGLLMANTSAGQYVHQDLLGSVRLMTTSTAGTAFASDYRPFGAQINRAGTDQNIKFTAEWQSSSTGLYYHQAGYYDPQVGRFSSGASMLGRVGGPQSLNRYEYAENNPVSSRPDPDIRLSMARGAARGLALPFYWYGAATGGHTTFWPLPFLQRYHIYGPQNKGFWSGYKASDEPGHLKFAVNDDQLGKRRFEIHQPDEQTPYWHGRKEFKGHIELDYWEGEGFANVLEWGGRASKALIAVSIAVDAYRLGAAINYGMDTGDWSAASVEGAEIAGGWGGAWLGAEAGAYLGASAGPVGIVVGGVIGGVVGGIAGEAAVRAFLDYQPSPGGYCDDGRDGIGPICQGEWDRRH